ncbi:MAG: DEAD/DEAH box helicase family protein [Bacilli bacterium]
MIAGSNKKIKLEKHANYLKDIFSTSPYIELGNIDYKIMERIINFEKIDIEELADFKLQNSNVTNFNIENDELQNIIPYLFLLNTNKKNKSYKIFLTYGLLTYKNEEGKEVFSPIILIPVNLFFEDEKVYIQKFSRAIINTVLNKDLEKILSVERKRILNISSADNFNNLYSMDKYILSMASIPGFDVKLENYLTVGETIEKDIKIDHNRFPITRAHEAHLNDKYYTSHNNLVFLFLMNKRQREALLNAVENNNFVIVGRMGTGKTTTLINICLEKIKDGKRVLYVSNRDETLNQVSKYFEDNNLENYIVNFSNSFSSFYYGEAAPYTKKPPIINNNIPNLLEKYEVIQEYEKIFYSKILDNRYLEVQNELNFLSLKPTKALNIDDLDKLYKADFLKVVKGLEIVEHNRKTVKCIFESLWNEIPLTNNIKSRKEILNLIYAIHRSFKILESEKEVLEKDFGIVQVLNLAMLRNIIRTIKRLTIGDIPQSWKQKGFAKYLLAEKLYADLKREINNLQEAEYHLDNTYHDLNQIKINNEIVNALGTYYSEDDFERIDSLLLKRKDLVLLANKASYNKELFENSITVIQKSLNMKLVLNVEDINFLIEFSLFLKNINITETQAQVALNKNHNNIVQEMTHIQNEYIERIKTIKRFEKNYPNANFKQLDTCLEIFKSGYFNRENKKLLSAFISDKRKFNKPLFIEEISNDIQNTIRNIEIIEELKKRYFILSNLNIEDYEEDYKNISLIIDYLEKIKGSKYIKGVLHLFKKNEKLGNTRFIKIENSFTNFLSSYREFQNMNLIYTNYGFTLNQHFIGYYYEIIKINQYLQKLFSSNDRLASVVNDESLDYISFKTYLDIRDSQNLICSINESLKNNDIYREIYGEMYNEGLSNINAISRVIQNFGNYIKCFNEDKDVIESLKIDVSFKLGNHLNRCLEVSDEINILFQNYSKIFKFGVTKFLYADYNETIEYMSSLLRSEDELIAYLNIIEGLKPLYENNLNKLVDYIVNLKEKDTLINDFKYSYYLNLQNLFLSKYENINNYIEIQKQLEEIVELEEEITQNKTFNIVNYIRKYSGNKYSIHNIKELDYISYLKRTKNIKNLVLTPTSIVNHYLDINDFDVVIIDDAHLLHANEYNEAIKGKQVIICGELQLQSVASNNLICRMRSNAIINMNYRFIPSPKNLLNNMEGSRGVIKNTFSANKGIKIINTSILEFIINLYIENINLKVNIFVKSFDNQKHIYEQLTNLFVERKISKKQIIDIFTNKLNIVDLSLGYLYHSDYNIIYLEDYFDFYFEPLIHNMIDYMLQCTEELIIYDSRNYLKQINFAFVDILNRIIENSDKKIFNNKIINKSVLGLGKLLISKGYKVFSGHDDFSLTLEKDDKMYGVLLFSDYLRNNYEILNQYRDYYSVFKKNNFKVIIVWVNSENNNLDKIASKIIKEINDGESNN